MKSYLGDGVYIDKDEFSNIILTTENGIAVHNTIVLEPAVLYALLEHLCRDVDLPVAPVGIRTHHA